MILIEKIKKIENSFNQCNIEMENKKALIREIVNLTHELNPTLNETISKFIPFFRSVFENIKKG